jgi:hypothetical protein
MGIAFMSFSGIKYADDEPKEDDTKGKKTTLVEKQKTTKIG